MNNKRKPPQLDPGSERRRMREIIKILSRTYPEAQCSLNFRSPFELLIATILAAQCTDERVNRVTPALFRRFPNPEGMAGADLGELESLIQSTGFFRSKAQALREASRSIVEEHRGKVPRTLEALMELRGVGRKTANVVMGNCFEPVGIAVDTHVGRLSRRLGFSRETDPAKVEQDLQKAVSREAWSAVSHLMIFHGRAICTARKPACPDCPIARFCPKIGVSRPEL